MPRLKVPVPEEMKLTPKKYVVVLRDVLGVVIACEVTSQGPFLAIQTAQAMHPDCVPQWIQRGRVTCLIRARCAHCQSWIVAGQKSSGPAGKVLCEDCTPSTTRYNA